MGLLALQSFLLLLELGRERIRLGKSFLFALEEPELHIPPGMQRRLIFAGDLDGRADDLHQSFAPRCGLLSRDLRSDT